MLMVKFVFTDIYPHPDSCEWRELREADFFPYSLSPIKFVCSQKATAVRGHTEQWHKSYEKEGKLYEIEKLFHIPLHCFTGEEGGGGLCVLIQFFFIQTDSYVSPIFCILGLNS